MLDKDFFPVLIILFAAKNGTGKRLRHFGRGKEF